MYIDTTALPAAQIWLYSTISRDQNIIFHVKTGEMATMFNTMAAILKKLRQIFLNMKFRVTRFNFQIRKIYTL